MKPAPPSRKPIIHLCDYPPRAGVGITVCTRPQFSQHSHHNPPNTMPRHLRFLLPILALVLAFGGFTGCATVPQADAFDVTLVNLSAADATLFESQVVVTLRYTNGTNTPLALSGSRHKIFLNGRAVGIAVSADGATIAGLSTLTQDLTLNLNHLSLIGLLREVQTNPAVRYEIDSTLYLGRSSGAARAIHTGTIDLQAFAKASSQK